MFDKGPDVHPMVARLFRTPRPVWVDLDALLSRWKPGLTRASEIPLIVRTQGLPLEQVKGQQLGWLRSSRGQWLGVVTFTMPTAMGDLPCQVLLPVDRFRLRKPDPTDQPRPNGTAHPNAS
ncbi:hypothetical protein ACH347_34385 [Saccharopolyspora sp. 5N102]|uniref:hypothetical protein n=1 Tax=Saccharopolyspora sp. 5N102 TaxID=3375155 RepID=UPI0037A8DB32